MEQLNLNINDDFFISEAILNELINRIENRLIIPNYLLPRLQVQFQADLQGALTTNYAYISTQQINNILTKLSVAIRDEEENVASLESASNIGTYITAAAWLAMMGLILNRNSNLAEDLVRNFFFIVLFSTLCGKMVADRRQGRILQYSSLQSLFEGVLYQRRLAQMPPLPLQLPQLEQHQELPPTTPNENKSPSFTLQIETDLKPGENENKLTLRSNLDEKTSNYQPDPESTATHRDSKDKDQKGKEEDEEDNINDSETAPLLKR